MRLKGNIINGTLIHEIASNFEKFEKNILLMFFKEELIIHLTSIQQPGIHIRSILPTNKIFGNYRIDSQNNNTIFIEIESNLLSRTIKSNTSSDTIFRLYKHGENSYLRITKGEREHVKGQIALTLDLPIRILTKSQMELIKEPGMSESTIEFQLPKVGLVRHELSRMKYQNHKVKVGANLAGEVRFSLRTESAEVNVTFANNIIPTFQNLPAPDIDFNASFQELNIFNIIQVPLEMKQLNKIFNTTFEGMKKAICSIVENQAFKVYFKLTSPLGEELGELTFYLPAVLD
ncbi:hypothetical protein K502DRAFT_365791 [Neoconidiobolus thromboides FSU 785]|nr:hypothetical protein K502DRAFT_365791 [Neoconidiobolus thromboides FSU 785]